ncbi:MAG: hypothetical protein AB1645_04360 [Bacillota bacterium]
MQSGRYSAGALLAFLAGTVGVIVPYVLFIRGYHALINLELAAGRPDEAIIITYVMPLLTDLMILAGLLWLVAGLGFTRRASWAWPLAASASVLGLASSFFLMIPAMSRGAFPAHILVFGPNLIFFFTLLAWVNPIDRRALTLSFFTGIACVLSFMNGVASMDKIMVTGLAIYVPAQQLCWVAAVGWGVFTTGLLVRAGWVYPVGLGAGLLAALAGLPLAVTSTLEAGRPSMFSPAPVLSLILLAVILLPRTRRWLEEWLT